MDKPLISLVTFIIFFFTPDVPAQDIITIRPDEIDDVLVNPGKGFTTFQCFNGDYASSATRGYPGVGGGYVPNVLTDPLPSYKFDSSLDIPDHPRTSVAYFRINWSYFEPEKGNYRWNYIDSILITARQRGQTVILRISPYAGRGRADQDVPDWYRSLVGDEQRGYTIIGRGTSQRKIETEWWKVDHNDPRYVLYFGNMIRSLGSRYDGHPDLEAMDLSICGMAGEGVDTPLLEEGVRNDLVKAYTRNFRKTPLIVLGRTDVPGHNVYTLARSEGLDVGWRLDCLGDMFGFRDNWSHMYDVYPQAIEQGMQAQDAWKKAPVAFEACWTMMHWKEHGWDINYIIDQSLKWHISTFNNKSSPVPEEWVPEVENWIKRMGYRFVLRKFTYPEEVHRNGRLSFTSWWENKGVAPIYRDYMLAIRLKGENESRILATDADLTAWLPGDNMYDNSVFIPLDIPAGDYDIQIGIVDPHTRVPAVKLAITGLEPDGWYQLGKISIKN
jgi:hypothetical protein